MKPFFWNSSLYEPRAGTLVCSAKPLLSTKAEERLTLHSGEPLFHMDRVEDDRLDRIVLKDFSLAAFSNTV